MLKSLGKKRVKSPVVFRKNNKPRTLLVGNMNPMDFEFSWWKWMQNNNFPIQPFDPVLFLKNKFLNSRFFTLGWKLFHGQLVSIIDHKLLDLVRLYKPELILVVSGNIISANILRTIKQETSSILYHFYGEDFFNPLNTTKTLIDASFVYDHLFTTKSFNVSEMVKFGLSNVSYIPHGYRPNCHFPVHVNKKDIIVYGSDISFVGTYEFERACILNELSDFNLKIWGSNWNKAPKMLNLENRRQNRAVYCKEMSKVFNSSKINLAFLRKANRDLHTSRTFEIPACGGFQLSERTSEVLSFFDEGKEIECFESIDELKEKSHFYLKHSDKREKIAIRGLSRIQRCSYSYIDRLKSILSYFNNPK